MEQDQDKNSEPEINENKRSKTAGNQVNISVNKSLLIILTSGVVVLLILATVAFFARGFDKSNFRDGAGRRQMMLEDGGMPEENGRMQNGRENHGGDIYSGSITSIDGDNLTVKINNKDIKVIISDDTSIFDAEGNISSKSDLKTNQSINIRGRADSSGQIKANTIRIK